MVCYLTATAVIASGYALNESTCVWHAITGLPCPGCGMIHALLAIGSGDLPAAWKFNPGSFAVAPILLWTSIQRMKELVE